MRAKRILTSQRGIGLTEVVVSAGVLSVLALGMATLTDTVSRSQRTNRTIASRDDLKSSVDRFSKNYSALKNSALNPAVTNPGNLKFSDCMGTPRGGPPCDTAETPFLLLGPLVGTGAFPQSTTRYSGNFDQNGVPCDTAGPNCPIVIQTSFTCQAPCTAGSRVFDINYTIGPAAGIRIPIRQISTTAEGRTFPANAATITSASGVTGTANTLVKFDGAGNNMGSSQILEDATGKVGMGTDTPTTKLEINGVDTTQNLFSIREKPGFTTPGLNGDMVLFESVYSNGNSGFNTLHVKGNISNDGSGGPDPNTLLYLEHTNPAAGAGAGYILHTFAGRNSLSSESVITQEGKWGIGTTAPTARLEVNGGTSDNGAFWNSGKNIFLVDANHGSIPASNGDVAHIISKSGNTNAGLTTLHVEGNIADSNGGVNPNTLLYLEHSNPAAIGGGGFILRTKAGRNSVISESVITQDGRWGIGTTNPQSTLDINGTARLAKNAAEPYPCDAAHDGALALTSNYQLCVCKSLVGWVLSSNGTGVCSWSGGGGGSSAEWGGQYEIYGATCFVGNPLLGGDGTQYPPAAQCACPPGFSDTITFQGWVGGSILTYLHSCWKPL